MLWKDYVMKSVKLEADRAGGVRALSRKIKTDPATISKMMRGIYIPSEKNFKKHFPEIICPTVVEIVDDGNSEAVIKERIANARRSQREKDMLKMEVIFEHGNGLSNKSISKIIGLPESTIRYILKEA